MWKKTNGWDRMCTEICIKNNTHAVPHMLPNKDKGVMVWVKMGCGLLIKSTMGMPTVSLVQVPTDKSYCLFYLHTHTQVFPR